MKNKQLKRGGGRTRRKLVLLGQVIRQHAATRMAPGRIVLPSHHFPLVSRLRAPPQGSRKHWPRPCGITPCRLLQLSRSAPDKHPGCRLVRADLETSRGLSLDPIVRCDSTVTALTAALPLTSLPAWIKGKTQTSDNGGEIIESCLTPDNKIQTIKSEIETVVSLPVQHPGAEAAS